MNSVQNSILKKFTTSFYLERVFPMIREEKTQRFITAAFTLLAISFFGIFAISPTLSTIADLQKQLSDNQHVDLQLQQKITDLSSLEQQYSMIQGDLPIIYAALPLTPQAPLLIAELQGLMQEHHLTLSTINTLAMPIAPLSGSNNVDPAYDFSLEMQGNQKDILAFLDSLSHFNRIITINTMLFGLAQKGDTQNVTSLSLKGQAHYKSL